MAFTDLSRIDTPIDLTVIDEAIFQTHIAAPIEDLIPIARWGTRGKGGKDAVKYVKLIDCETDHLEAIIQTQPFLGFGHKTIIQAILQQRKTQNTLPTTATNE